MADEPQLDELVGGLRREFVDGARDSALGRPDAGPREAGGGEGTAGATAAPAAEAAAEASEEGAAAPVVQEPTLDEARANGLKLERKSLRWMSPSTFSGKSLTREEGLIFDWPGRKDWYVQALGPYEDQLRESSTNHQVPERLIAAVILVELTDIDADDLAQEGFIVLKGSLGIAQIQVDTVIRDDLFLDISEEEIREAALEFAETPGMHVVLYRNLESREIGLRMAIRNRLFTPQYAIDAAAREIRKLLWLMVANREKPWQALFGFTWQGTRLPDPNLLYQEIGDRVWCRSIDEISEGGEFEARGNESANPPKEREKNLAYMVAAAYNSPDVIKTDDLGSMDKLTFEGGRTQGHNACSIAADLYDLGLFGPRPRSVRPLRRSSLRE